MLSINQLMKYLRIIIRFLLKAIKLNHYETLATITDTKDTASSALQANIFLFHRLMKS